jgi:5-methylcytosine-specific restriction endonuclease McrA
MPKPPKRKNPRSRNLRRLLDAAILRDGFTCHICGLRTEHGIIPHLCPTADHVIPVSLGGRSTFKNIKVAHEYCNHYRGNKTITEEIRTHCRSRIFEIRASQGGFLLD